MTILSWQISSNIENSLADFLQSKLDNVSLQVLNTIGVPSDVNLYIGRTLNNNWNLPLIQIYYDSKQQPRLEIGSNLRNKSYNLIIDIRGCLPGQESNIADWLEAQINDGFAYYTYTPNVSNPDAPTKVQSGYVSVDFLSSMPLPIQDDADKFDKYRYRISIRTWVS